MTDDALLAELSAASPTFGTQWRLIAEAYPETKPAALTDALLDLSGYLLGLASKDRRHELGPLLGAVERCYEAGSPTQQDQLRDWLLHPLRVACEDGGLDPATFLVHFGPRCKVAWNELGEPEPKAPVA